MIQQLKKTFLYFVICIVPLSSSAEVIEFPSEELAQESVLPKFDRPLSVKNRNVETAKKIELGAYYGWNVLEPILNPSKFGLIGAYHVNEDAALSLNFSMWMKGLNSQYTDGLKNSSNINLDFSRSPQLNYSAYGYYEWKMFYGKISVTKSAVKNTHIYPMLGAGVTSYENKTYPGIAGGIGQKFYFGKAFALRADFRYQYAQQPSPFKALALRPGTDAVPAKSSFKDKWALSNHLEFGFSYLF
ncbi:MAG: outer membrane beta-barrel domain-containing protein [Pseudobdellovibrionaceae bacterium]